jgi:hypothetical protein
MLGPVPARKTSTAQAETCDDSFITTDSPATLNRVPTSKQRRFFFFFVCLIYHGTWGKKRQFPSSHISRTARAHIRSLWRC